MSDNPYVGRAEELTASIVKRIFPGSIVYPQYHIKHIISTDERNFLGEELKKHKFDFLIKTGVQTLAVEVNYKHGNRAAIKWEIYKKFLAKYKILPVTFDDWDCRSSEPKTLGLFQLTGKKEHKDSWNDWRDVIDQLEKAEVKAPNLSN